MKTETIIDWFLWLIYWLLTLEERHFYSMGKMKGMHCVGRELVRPGVFDYIYDPTKKPTREFDTRKEFFHNQKQNRLTKTKADNGSN